MRKMVKALALALALCMVLSVSAFAEVGKDENPTVDMDARTVAFNVTGLQDGEQVALLVLVPDTAVTAADEKTILYIDQTAADEDGVASFTATIAEGSDVVDVWVGSSTIATAWNVYEDVEVAETSSITLAKDGEVRKVLDPTATGTVQYGVAIKMNINKINVEKMIWAFSDGTKTFYSKPIMLNYTGCESVEGNVWFTAAVAPGIIGDGDEQLSEISTVNAIFRCNNQNYFTNDNDKKAEVGYTE